MIQPQILVYPFATNGDYTNIPENGNNDDIFTSQKVGFPQTMSQDMNVPREQMNGVLNLYSQIIVFLNSGGFYTFDPVFQNYQKGSVLFYKATNFNGFLISNIDNNNYNFIQNPTTYIGDATKPWSKITSYLPDIIDENGLITFLTNVITDSNITINGLLTANNGNFLNRPFITSLPSNDIIIDGKTYKTNEVATLGDLQATTDARCNVDQGFGGSVTDTGYNSNTPLMQDGGSIGKWCSFYANFSEFANSAVCQVICSCSSYKAVNGYDTLAGRVEIIRDANAYLTSFGLNFGEFFNLPQTFLSTSGVSISYNGTDIQLQVNGGGCETLTKTYMNFVNIIVSPKVVLKQKIYSDLISKFEADNIITNKNNLTDIKYIKNKNVYNYNSLKDESTLISSLKNYNNVSLITKIENGDIKTNKKITKIKIKDINKKIKLNENIDIFDYINKK